MREKYQIRFWAAGLLVLFVTYYATVALYAHVHWVNGVAIVHSHPFSGKHTHTPSHTFVLHSLSNICALEAGQTDVIRPKLFVFYSLLYNTDMSSATLACVTCFFLRAPPSPSFLLRDI